MVTLFLNGNAAPSKVTDLTAATASPYPDQVVLSWTAPDNGGGQACGDYRFPACLKLPEL